MNNAKCDFIPKNNNHIISMLFEIYGDYKHNNTFEKTLLPMSLTCFNYDTIKYSLK